MLAIEHRFFDIEKSKFYDFLQMCFLTEKLISLLKKREKIEKTLIPDSRFSNLDARFEFLTRTPG